MYKMHLALKVATIHRVLRSEQVGRAPVTMNLVQDESAVNRTPLYTWRNEASKKLFSW